MKKQPILAFGDPKYECCVVFRSSSVLERGIMGDCLFLSMCDLLWKGKPSQ